MRGEPQVRRRGAQPCRAGLEGFSQLFQGPLVPGPGEESLQGTWGKELHYFPPAFGCQESNKPLLCCVFRPPLFPHGSGLTGTRKHKGFGFDQLQ